MRLCGGMKGLIWRLTYHIHQRHVQEHARRDGEDPVGDVVRVLAHGGADEHPDVGHEGRQQIIDDGLLHRHPSFQQNGKITCQREERRSLLPFPSMQHFTQHRCQTWEKPPLRLTAGEH